MLRFHVFHLSHKLFHQKNSKNPKIDLKCIKNTQKHYGACFSITFQACRMYKYANYEGQLIPMLRFHVFHLSHKLFHEKTSKTHENRPKIHQKHSKTL